MNKGIFWLTKNRSGEEQLLTVKASCDDMGTPLVPVEFSSKSGENFNHQAEWAKLSPRLTQGRTFDYYPRGRIEIKNGRVTVYCHPELTQLPYRNWIVEEFDIPEGSRFVADGSVHYRALGR